MITNLLCVIHKFPLNIVNFATAIDGSSQSLYLLCPQCQQIISTVTNLSDTINTLDAALNPATTPPTKQPLQ